MRIILLLALSGFGAFGQEQNVGGVPEMNRLFAESELLYFQHLQCIKRLDTILSNKWHQELERIPINDLGEVEPRENSRRPSKKMYNTVEQEWLMEQGSTSRPIDTCFRGFVEDIASMLDEQDRGCLGVMLYLGIQDEMIHEQTFKSYLEKESREQLPFHKFVNFTQFVDIMYQNRNTDALTAVERDLYVQAESYLATEQDRVDRIYIMEQDCEWKNAKALREAPTENARYEEFVRQIRDSLNQQLGNHIVLRWNLNSTLSNEKWTSWQQIRQKVMPRINEELARLRNQEKDSQWLCEYATKLAYEFSDREAAVLFQEDNSRVDLEVSNVAKKARGIEKVLEKNHDSRHTVVNNLANEYENRTICLTALLHLIQNQQRFNMALLVIEEQYSYPEFFCKEKSTTLGLVNLRLCKCVGSFCVAHSLGHIFSEEYALEQGPDGTYRVARSGLTSRDKVRDWGQ